MMRMRWGITKTSTRASWLVVASGWCIGSLFDQTVYSLTALGKLSSHCDRHHHAQRLLGSLELPQYTKPILSR